MAEMGRPTVMTEEVLAKLKEAYLSDATDSEACHIAEIAQATLYLHQKAHPYFLEKKLAWKNMTKYRAKKVVATDIQSGDKDTSKWYLERKGKNEGFSTRQEISGVDGKDFPVPILGHVSTDNSDKQDPQPTE